MMRAVTITPAMPAANPTADDIAALVLEVLTLGGVSRSDGHPCGTFVTVLAERITGHRMVVSKHLATQGCYSNGRIVIRAPFNYDVPFTIAHELGHHSIRRLRNWGWPPNEEEMANLFATLLLERGPEDAKWAVPARRRSSASSRGWRGRGEARKLDGRRPQPRSRKGSA